MSEVLFSALRDIDRASKKQRTCSSRTREYLDQLEAELQQTREQVACCSSVEGRKTLLRQLNEKIQQLQLPSHIAAQQKEFYGSVSRVGKVVERHFSSSSTSNTTIKLDDELINEAVANHLFREGQSELGHKFCEESGISVPESIVSSFAVMHEIVKELQKHNLKPALEWAAIYKNTSNKERFSSLDFKLHSMQFIHLISTEGCKAALKYARTNLSKFSNSHMTEIQQLMGCLLYHSNIKASPYKDLLSNDHWNDIQQEFVRECCHDLNQACESPLLVVSAAGALAIPTLAKFATVMAKKQDWATLEQLPVEIELGNDFTFYSIFACPISRDQASPGDPPMMLPCGHVLSRQAVTKLSKSNTKAFKCPYCPFESTITQCMQITF